MTTPISCGIPAPRRNLPARLVFTLPPDATACASYPTLSPDPGNPLILAAAGLIISRRAS